MSVLFKLKYQMMAQKAKKDIKLLPDQQKAYDYMTSRDNIFLTGGGGVGKSELIKRYKKNNPERIIAVTSTTGTSALLIDGTTLHSYLGIGLGQGSVDSMTMKILKRTYLRKRWRELETLIVDEVSMLSPILFDKLEEVARAVRRNDYPFGGIQLILSGDYLQLPVVREDSFCFEAKSWDKCIDHTVYLTEIVRQKEVKFQNCLNKVRVADIDEEVRDILLSRKGVELKNDFGIKPTQLFSTNYAVSEINDEEMDKLAEEDPDFYEYNLSVEWHVKKKDFVEAKIKKNCQAVDCLQLCVGAQVILLYNLDLENKLANGSRGVVTKFIEDKPVVKFLSGVERIIDYHVWDIEENDKTILSICQVPLRLAWAITIHRCQGQTLDYAIMDLSEIFEYGQAYVALSRIESLSGLSIIDIDFAKIKAHPKALKFYKKLKKLKK